MGPRIYGTDLDPRIEDVAESCRGSTTKKMKSSNALDTKDGVSVVSIVAPHTIVASNSGHQSDVDSGFEDSLFDGLYDKKKVINQNKPKEITLSSSGSTTEIYNQGARGTSDMFQP